MKDTKIYDCFLTKTTINNRKVLSFYNQRFYHQSVKVGTAVHNNNKQNIKSDVVISEKYKKKITSLV